MTRCRDCLFTLRDFQSANGGYTTHRSRKDFSGSRWPPPALSFFSTKSPHTKSTLTKTTISPHIVTLRPRDKRQYTQQNSGYKMWSLTPSWLRNCRVHVVTLSLHTLCLLSLCLCLCLPYIRLSLHLHTVQLHLKNMWPVESLIASL